MRFLVMHKVDAHMEAGEPPSPQIVEQMGALVQESLKAGIFKNGAGLHRSTLRSRVRFQSGSRKVTQGPLIGDNELVSAFFVIRAASMDQAIDHAARIAGIVGDVEIEVGPIVEPWDLGLIPKPEDPGPTRYLLLQKATVHSEKEPPFEVDGLAALAKLEGEMAAEGVLLAAERLAPSSRGSRLAAGRQPKRTWTDGPFAESKELIAGFSLLDLPSKHDAVAWAERYAAILDGNEVDLREVLDV